MAEVLTLGRAKETEGQITQKCAFLYAGGVSCGYHFRTDTGGHKQAEQRNKRMKEVSQLQHTAF